MDDQSGYIFNYYFTRLYEIDLIIDISGRYVIIHFQQER